MTANPVQPVIKFEGVRKSFGATAAVDGISFSAEAGETVALLGPSGCGKTTTLRLIAGFEEPDAGLIEIGSESVVGLRPYERNVGLLFQHYALFPHMSVGENIAYGLKQRNWPKAEIGTRVAEMLRLVQLEGLADRRPRQLSGGQQQRVALARVLATKPKLVLLDEPLSALDAKLREELGAELKQILGAVGSTTLVVTHDQDEAMSLADRIIVMNRGRIDQQGAPSDIYAHPANRFVAAFMGRSNWLDGTLKLGKGGGFASVVLNSGIVLSVTANGIADGSPISLGIRPERITIAASEDTEPAMGANQFPGEVLQSRYMGAEIHYQIGSAIGPLMLVQPSTRTKHFEMAAKVKISFSAEDCIVFPIGTRNG